MGRSIDQACKRAKVSRRTVERWRSRGRMVDADPTLADFARRFDAAGRVLPVSPTDTADRPLTDAELEAVIEDAARRGSAESAKALLVERRKGAEPEEEPPGLDLTDPLLGVEIDAIERHGYPDRYPMLTPEEREQVLRLHDERFAAWLAEDEAKADAGDPAALVARREREAEAAER